MNNPFNTTFCHLFAPEILFQNPMHLPSFHIPNSGSQASRMATLKTARKLWISRATPSAAMARLQSTEPDAAPKRSSSRAEPSRTPRLS